MDFGVNGNSNNNDDIMISIENDIIFSDDPFPTLPDFPTANSSPENSTDNKFAINPSVSTSSSSSSSAPPWSYLTRPNQTQESNMHPGPLRPEPGSDNPNQEETDLFNNIDLWDGSNGFDASFFFAEDSEPNNVQEQVHHHDQPADNYDAAPGANPNQSDQELSNFFLEWLKNNRDTIAPEDLKKIKLKTSTIERAAARLGGGKEGKMQLLKLILTWVQNHHLQTKKRRAGEVLPNCPPWMENVNSAPSNYDQYNHMQSTTLAAPFSNPYYQSHPFSSSMDFNAFSPPPPPMIYNPYPINTILPHVHYGSGGFGSTYSMFPSMAGSASATKEARKKRMARQRRLSTLHQNKAGAKANAAKGVNEIGSSSSSRNNDINNNSGGVTNDWAFWSSNRRKNLQKDGGGSQANAQQNRVPTTLDKQPGWKAEKNMRFLLQKVLKQSDVGSLGRIVLPKEAESHLPELDTRDGITIPMEDIGTSRVWNMRYRFWPNNKSRMYLLENTGDFVRSNNLQEGDFIVIYSDVKCNKYMIRGVKVRQAIAEPKGAAASSRKMQTTAKGHQKINSANLKAEKSGDRRNIVDGKNKMVKASSYSKELDEEVLPSATMVDAI